MLLAEAGIDVKYHHHEVGGSGQLEIEVELGDVVKMADHTMNIKYIIKNQAILEGKDSYILPKPLHGGGQRHACAYAFEEGQ